MIVCFEIFLIHLKSKAALKNFLNLEGFVRSETLFDSAKLWAKTGFFFRDI